MADNDNNKTEQVSSPRGEDKKHKDKKKDKPKHSGSSSNVVEKPATPRGAETKEPKEPINTPAKETRTNRGPTEDVTEFLNDPKLQTGIKHKLVRKGN